MVDSPIVSRKGSAMSAMSAVRLPDVPKKIYTTWPDMIRHWPKTTLCIVSNEFCERFSYYGMRTVLILYLLNVLKFTDNQSTIFFNSFTVLCYTTPMLGSIIADGYIGKFWTIFSVSILYAAGQIILALASTKNFESSVHPWMDLSGLIIIGFGTGGIKPCVSAFGADQFEVGQERMLSLYFSMFYFSINAGSMISTFISPIFRSQPCMGQDSCYPLAFGVPAVLMIVATAIFMSGSFWYKKPPPKENIFGEVSRLMGRAVANKTKSKESKEHWLDHYMTTHVCENDPKCIELKAEKRNKNACSKKSMIEDVKSLLRVLVMFLPVPMFWALYDQQGSVWLIQGIQMDCRLSDTLMILPDQMQTLNAVLILIFIPLFQVVIYPLASMCIELTPLRKMVAGGLLASLAFLITGFVQLQVNTTLPNLPDNGYTFVSVWNQLPPGCNVTATYSTLPPVIIQPNAAMIDDKKGHTSTFHIPSNDTKHAKKDSTIPVSIKLDLSGNCPAGLQLTSNYQFTATNKKVYYIAVSQNGIYHAMADPTKPTQGTGEFSLGITTAMPTRYLNNLCMCRVLEEGDKNYQKVYKCNPRRPSDFYYWETSYNGGKNHDIDANATYTKSSGDVMGNYATVYTFKPVKPGKWDLYFLYNTPKDVNYQTYAMQNVLVNQTGIRMEIHGQGGVYVLALTGNDTNPTGRVWQLVQENSVNILWQVPQIVVITAAEILFSITGYEFAYSQSAPSMKALVQALWLLTTAVGDSIIVLITALNLFQNMATQFFVYAGVMALVIIVFALMSIFYYEYNYYTQDKEDSVHSDSESCDSDEDEHEKKRFSVARDNGGFVGEVEQMELDEMDMRM